MQKHGIDQIIIDYIWNWLMEMIAEFLTNTDTPVVNLTVNITASTHQLNANLTVLNL